MTEWMEQEVRRIHSPRTIVRDVDPPYDLVERCVEDHQLYPCATIKAIGGR